jgi:thiamine-monophosphate kinase
MHGGEDYELLFTVNEQGLDEVRQMPDVNVIGIITDAREGIRLTTSEEKVHPITAQGWNHFKK